MVIGAEEWDIMTIIFVDHCGVAAPLNLALDYMFSQTVSTVLHLEYPKFLPKTNNSSLSKQVSQRVPPTHTLLVPPQTIQ